MIRCCVTDRVLLTTSRVVTPEGFLRAPARIARTGIQLYTVGELRIPGLDANKIVRVFRPADEVFSFKALKSFDGQTLTNDHPRGGVDSTNWRQVAVGDVHNVHQEGDYVVADLVIRDEAAKAAVMAGKALLSCGYDFSLVLKDGVAPDGTPFDAIQTDIVGNHVALCDSPRGGSALRIADSEQETNVKKKIKRKTPIADAPRIELPLVGRRAMLARHAANAAPKGAAAKAGGLHGRHAFAHAHRFSAGGAK